MTPFLTRMITTAQADRMTLAFHIVLTAGVFLFLAAMLAN